MSFESKEREVKSKIRSTGAIIGWTSETITATIEQLDAQVLAVYEGQLQQQEDIVQRYTVQVEEQWKLVRSVRALLGLGQEWTKDEDAEIDEKPLQPRLEKIKSLHQFLTSKYETHCEKFEVLRSQLKQMWEILGVSSEKESAERALDAESMELDLPIEQCTDLSTSKLKKIQHHIEAAESLRDERARRVAREKDQISTLLVKLGKDANVNNIADLMQQEDLTLAFINQLREVKQKLTDRFTEIESQVQQYIEPIRLLWNRLEIPTQDRGIDGSFELYPGILNDCREELDKLKLLAQQRLQGMIEAKRDIIFALFEDMSFSDEQRDQFSPLESDDFTEDMLTVHEREIVTLAEMKESSRHLVALAEKREAFLADLAQLDAKAQDGSRLLSMSGAQARQNFKDLQLRNKIEKQMPKLNSVLIQKIKQWQESYQGHTFMYNNQPYLQAVEEVEQRVRDQKNQRREHVNAAIVPASTLKPSNSLKRSHSHSHTPNAAHTDQNQTVTSKQLVSRGTSSTRTPLADQNTMPLTTPMGNYRPPTKPILKKSTSATKSAPNLRK